MRIYGIEGVDIIIPVYNNYAPLAFVLIGDIEEEGEGMSPVLKQSHLRADNFKHNPGCN